jgi:hypothetical protein
MPYPFTPPPPPEKLKFDFRVVLFYISVFLKNRDISHFLTKLLFPVKKIDVYSNFAKTKKYLRRKNEKANYCVDGSAVSGDCCVL